MIFFKIFIKFILIFLLILGSYSFSSELIIPPKKPTLSEEVKKKIISKKNIIPPIKPTVKKEIEIQEEEKEKVEKVETDKDFQETIDLCKQVQFAQAYSFNYSSRPGTPASRKEELDENLKKARLHVLQDLLKKQQTNFLSEQKNRIHKVLFEKIGRGIDEYVGRTEQFSPVTVVSKENLVGEIRMVKINSVMSHSLKGVVK